MKVMKEITIRVRGCDGKFFSGHTIAHLYVMNLNEGRTHLRAIASAIA